MSLLLLFGGGPVTPTGVHSLLAFWMGGAGAITAAATITISPRPLLRMRMGMGR